MRPATLPAAPFTSQSPSQKSNWRCSAALHGAGGFASCACAPIDTTHTAIALHARRANRILRMFAMAAPDYLNPALPDGLRRVRMPVVDATDASLQGYGTLVDDPAQCKV